MSDRIAPAEMLSRVIGAATSAIRTATLGRIHAYFDSTQTADVEQVIRPDGEEQAMLPGRPVLVPGGAEAYLLFPHAAGDTGLVVFCETDTGAFIASGDVGAPADEGRHNASGAVFIPGVRVSSDTLLAATGATVLSADDLRLGDALATEPVLCGNLARTAITTWASAVALAIAGLGGDISAATSQLSTNLDAAKSPSVKVENP